MNILEALIQTKTDLQTWVINNLINKVDKEDGKGLSSNDFTNKDKAKLNEINNKLSLTGGTMTGDIDMGNKAITNIIAPTEDQDAATKKYVDDAISGFSSKVFQIAASTDENLNTNLFLLDSADNMILKYYDENTTSWVPVTIGWG